MDNFSPKAFKESTLGKKVLENTFMNSDSNDFPVFTSSSAITAGYNPVHPPCQLFTLFPEVKPWDNFSLHCPKEVTNRHIWFLPKQAQSDHVLWNILHTQIHAGLDALKIFGIVYVLRENCTSVECW